MVLVLSVWLVEVVLAYSIAWHFFIHLKAVQHMEVGEFSKEFSCSLMSCYDNL